MKLVPLVVSLAFLSISSAMAQDAVKIKNRLDHSVELRVFSEKKMKWLQPSLNLEKGKTGELKIAAPGDHNFKAIVNGKEYLLGTFDLKRAVEKQNVDTIEILLSAKKSSGAATAKGGKKGVDAKGGKFRTETRTRKVPVNRMRTETRTREIVVTKKDGTKETKTQEYTVQVPYTELVEQAYQVEIPVDGGDDDESTEDDADADAGGDAEKFRIETRVRTKAVTRMRFETRTRMVNVTTGDGEVKAVPQTYTVQVPFTVQVEETYQVKIPLDGGQPIEIKKGKSVPSKNGTSKASTGLGLRFLAKGKVVKIQDSLIQK